MAAALVLLPTAHTHAQEPAPPSTLVRAQEAVLSREHELTRLETRRALLLSRRRHWQVPLGVAGVGVAALITGGVVFHWAWNPRCDLEDDDCTFSSAGDRAGLVLMPLGAAITLVATPLFAVRMARTGKLRRVEAALERLRAAPMPVLLPSGAALAWGTRF